MILVPIKLLPSGPTRKRLLDLKGDTDEIDKDDFLESKLFTKPRARRLLAIEDATDMAKTFLYERGVFETIMRDIVLESGKDVTYSVDDVSANYVLLEMTYENGTGHYALAVIDHENKTADIHDSMYINGSEFEESMRLRLGRRYKVRTTSFFSQAPQPTGGFVPDISTNGSLSQYDELSQHHFCYVESFVAMMTHLGLMSPGPDDPRERLEYIKRIVWNLMHRYVPMGKRNCDAWRFFKQNFPYILETRNVNGERFKLSESGTQIRQPSEKIRFKLKKINLSEHNL